MTPDPRRRMEQELAHLVQRLGGIAGIPLVPGGDLVDVAAQSEARDVAAGIREQQVARARELHAALERMADGTYGKCTHCGDAIGAKRLAAIPWAERCTPCQHRHEHEAARAAHRGRCLSDVHPDDEGP